LHSNTSNVNYETYWTFKNFTMSSPQPTEKRTAPKRTNTVLQTKTLTDEDFRNMAKNAIVNEQKAKRSKLLAEAKAKRTKIAMVSMSIVSSLSC